jgi:NTP pyrophosphatase (non-canonical NTP hydrolase)
MTDLLDTQREIHQIAVDHGFWEASTNIGEKLMLIVSEISEALEDYRDGKMSVTYDTQLATEFTVVEASGGITRFLREDGSEARGVVVQKPEGFPVELADAVIRILDLAAWLGIDLAAVIDLKVAYNKTRPHLHGRKL